VPHFSLSVEIQAPPARVWDVMSDVERWHEWTASITSIERQDRGPFAPGSTAVVRQPGFPAARWTVTDIVPGARFTWVNRRPGVTAVGRHEVEPLGAGSRATLAVDLTGPLAPLAWLFMRRTTEKFVGWEAAGLKRRCETT
jgi:uncharacterized protein YndB with AHSA1/START domain